jgi:hypothetical protein
MYQEALNASVIEDLFMTSMFISALMIMSVYVFQVPVEAMLSVSTHQEVLNASVQKVTN